MNTINYLDLTKQYYAQWLDVLPVTMDHPGVIAHCTALRDARQKGYHQPFPLYAWVSEGTVIISYSRSIEAEVKRVLQGITGLATPDQILCEMRHVFPSVQQGRKFVFEGLPVELETDATQAIQLTREDFPAYRRFNLEQYAQPMNMDWLEPYFNSIVDRGYVFGVYKEDILISATDAPDMPFMDNRVVEIGINTLKAYRGQGYAKLVVAGMLKHLIREEMVPLWSCAASNEASRALALSVGFRELAQTIYV